MIKKNRSRALVSLSIFLFVLFPLTAAARTSNDPQIADLTGPFDQIHVQDAWDFTQGSPDVVVAVIDTGVDITNPDLVGNVWVNPHDTADGTDNDGDGNIDDIHGWNFIDNNSNVRPTFTAAATRIGLNHGTIVAGIIGATGNNLTGASGVNWHVKIMALKILDEHGDGDSDLAVKAIDYAIKHNANIINLSFVGPTPSLNFIQAIRRAYRAGILVVAAGGNAAENSKGTDLNVVPQYPVCFDDPLKEENWVLGVAALTENGLLAPFSNFGSKCIDLAAPGTHIPATMFYDPQNGYPDIFGGSWSGTSIAAPFVTGVAALVKTVQPTWGPDQLIRNLIETTDSIPGNDTHAAGRGSLNALRAVRNAAQGGDGGLPTGVFVSTSVSKGATLAKIFDSSFVELKSFEISHIAPKQSVSLVTGDIDGSGVSNIIAAVPDKKGTLIRVFQRDGKLLRDVRPFGKSEQGAVQITTRDLDLDGIEEIIAASPSTHQVVIMDSTGKITGKIQIQNGKLPILLTTLREGSSTFIVTAVPDKKVAHVFVWDVIGSFIRSFDVLVTGTGVTLGTADYLGVGHEELFLSGIAGNTLTTQFYTLDGSPDNTRTAQIKNGKIFGFSFAFVKDLEGPTLVVAVQQGKNYSFQTADTHGAVQPVMTSVNKTTVQGQNLYFGR